MGILGIASYELTTSDIDVNFLADTVVGAALHVAADGTAQDIDFRLHVGVACEAHGTAAASHEAEVTTTVDVTANFAFVGNDDT